MAIIEYDLRGHDDNAVMVAFAIRMNELRNKMGFVNEIMKNRRIYNVYVNKSLLITYLSIFPERFIF